MKYILILKHWQVFLVFMAFSYLHSFGMPMHLNLTIILIIFTFWHYSVVISILSKVDANREHSTSLDFFKASCFLFPILWMASYWNYILAQNSIPTSGSHIIFITAVGAVLSYFYILWTTSGVLIKAEPVRHQNAVNRLLILIWLVLFPVGIWFIQPKVNKLKDYTSELIG